MTSDTHSQTWSSIVVSGLACCGIGLVATITSTSTIFLALIVRTAPDVFSNCREEACIVIIDTQPVVVVSSRCFMRKHWYAFGIDSGVVCNSSLTRPMRYGRKGRVLQSGPWIQTTKTMPTMATAGAPDRLCTGLYKHSDFPEELFVTITRTYHTAQAHLEMELTGRALDHLLLLTGRYPMHCRLVICGLAGTST